MQSLNQSKNTVTHFLGMDDFQQNLPDSYSLNH